jgi:hypothetical protein
MVVTAIEGKIICWFAECNMQSLFAIRLLLRFPLFLLTDWLFVEYHVSIRNYCSANPLLFFSA